MWVLAVEYLTHSGAEVVQTVPWPSAETCQRFLVWLVRTLEINGATGIAASCGPAA